MLTDIPLHPEHDGSALYLLGPTDPTTLESTVVAASRALMIDALGYGPAEDALKSMAATHHVGLRANLPRNPPTHPSKHPSQAVATRPPRWFPSPCRKKSASVA